MRKPWEIAGPDQRRDHPSLAHALRALYEGRPGPPTDADRPPISTFPVTRAAREAFRLSRGL